MTWLENAMRYPFLHAAGSPPPPSQRGPLARFSDEERKCHVCRRKLTTNPRGALRIQRSEGEVLITCGRCLPRQTRTGLTSARARLERARKELLDWERAGYHVPRR